jgi:hypothetical protein
MKHFLALMSCFCLLADLAVAQTFGEEKDEVAFELNTGKREWGDPPGCSTRFRAVEGAWTAPEGWVVLTASAVAISESNGQHRMEQRAGGLQIMSDDAIENVFRPLLLIAKAKNDTTALSLLQKERDDKKKEVVKFSDTKNVVYGYASAKAHGNCLTDRKSGWSHSRYTAKIRFVGSDRDGIRLQQEMAAKYKLNGD